MTANNKTVLSLLACLTAAACGSKEPSVPAEASAPVETPAAAAPAAPEPEPASAPVGSLGSAAQAKWQKYRCADEAEAQARYYRNGTMPEAQIRYRGGILTLPYSASDSDEDLTAFSNGEYAWTIGNEFNTDFYREANGFLIHREQTENADGAEGTVDDLLLHECTPAAS